MFLASSMTHHGRIYTSLAEEMKKLRTRVTYLIDVLYVLGRRNENSVATSQVHLRPWHAKG